MSEPDVYDVLSPGVEGKSPLHLASALILVEAPQKKPYDVAYKVRTLQEIMEMQNKEIKKVETLLEVPVGTLSFDQDISLDVQYSTATILLRHYVWNFEKLQEQFWNDPAVALQAAGLSPPSSPSRSTHALPPSSPRRPTRNSRSAVSSPTKRTRALPGPFECPICCMDFTKEQAATQTLALGCGHRFCRACWTEYLNGKVQGEGESVRIQCMESGCERVVREEVVDELVTSNVSKK